MWLHVIVVHRHPVDGCHVLSGHCPDGDFVHGRDEAGRVHEAGGGHRVVAVVVEHGDSGAGVDEQVAADGARVGDLALAHGSGPGPLRPGLAELVDLVHDAAQVGLPALVQPACHGERNG